MLLACLPEQHGVMVLCPLLLKSHPLSVGVPPYTNRPNLELLPPHREQEKNITMLIAYIVLIELSRCIYQ